MLRIKKVTGEDIRSNYKWSSKDPPFASDVRTKLAWAKVRLLKLFGRNLREVPSKQRQVKIGD